MSILDSLYNLWMQSGFANISWQEAVMLLISLLLLYLGIFRKFEPLLMVPIAFGILLANLPLTGMLTPDHNSTGLLDFLTQGLPIFPCLIFLGVGAMTDFGPLLSNPNSLFLGAAAQFGVYMAFIGATALGFTGPESASIGIIGGADGPTAIYLTGKLADHLMPAIAVAAYSYMALIPIIQPPLMKLFTTKKERQVKMEQLRVVSKTEKIIFPIIVTLFVSLLLPSVAPLLGCLMLGNLFKECGVTDRLSDTAQNAMMNIVTIFLGLCVGAKATGTTFLSVQTIYVIILGLCAFAFSTIGGLLLGKLMCVLSKGKINPLIGSAACFRCSDGCSCIPDRWSKGKSFQLLADARYGSKRSRCYRFRCCSRLPAGSLWPNGWCLILNITS